MSKFCKKGMVMTLALAMVLLISPLQSFASEVVTDTTEIEVVDSNFMQYDDEITDAQENETIAENQTETQEVGEEILPSTSSDYRAPILNSAPLNPVTPQSQDLDNLVTGIMDQIITEDMDTYEKVKACYDYITTHTTYGSHEGYLGVPVGAVTCGQIYQNYGEVEGYGAVVLSSGVGMCNAYASAFIVMAREIGLDAYLVRGSTQSAGGGYAYHEWAEVVIDGQVYVFDPQLEQNLTSAGLGTYTSFCKTYDEIPGRYVKI